MDELRDLSTVKELAAFLRKPVQTIYSWRAQGLGPPGIRLGRSLVFRKSDIIAWLDERAER